MRRAAQSGLGQAPPIGQSGTADSGDMIPTGPDVQPQSYKDIHLPSILEHFMPFKVFIGFFF